MTTATLTASRARPLAIALWVVQILCAAAFLAAATAKLTGQPMMVDVFARLGLGQGFRYVTAIVEVIGGIGLLVPRFAGKAALLLAATMLCAVLAHLTVLGGNPGPAIILLVLTGAIAWVRRRELVLG
ncbi:DoxX family protein [uncultured Sphingomonas sp.]|uniref:DoxX family protein n=1 Tax=uncultured Sphingomonas sp. TaxID=158754 RepID=UPI0035C9F432